VPMTSIIPRLGPGRPNPEWAAWAARRRGAYSPDTKSWARRTVEKIRSAWGAGRLQLVPWIDNYTEETPEIRDVYHRLLSEPMVKAGYGSKVWAVAALDCNVVPAEPDDPRHKQAATAFKWVLSQVGMGSKNGRPVGTQLIAWEVLSGACINGWSLCELVAGGVARRGPAAGKEYWRDIKAKDTRRLSPIVDEFKNVVAIRSWLAGARTWEGADLDSFVTYAHWPLYCSPNGMSDFRAVYRACAIKDAAMRLRALGLDRWTHPYLKATAATDEQKAALAEAMEDARGDGFVILPPGALVEAVQLATSSDDVFHNAIQDLDREILIGISWSHLPLQEGQTTGGRGDTEVQQGTAELGQWALASVLGGVVTGQMAIPWYERNYGDIEPGTVVWGAVNEKALLLSAQVDDALLKQGHVLSRSERARYYGRAAPKDRADALAAPGQGPRPPPGQPPGGAPAPFAEDFDAFCTQGQNAGKPGPCPEDVNARAQAAIAATRAQLAGGGGDRERRKAARKQARQDFHAAAREVFGDRAVADGDDVTVREANGRELRLEFRPEDRSVFIEFRQDVQPNPVPGTAGWDAVNRTLQRGSLDFARDLRAVTGKLGDKGLGVAYETQDPRRERVYAKLLSDAGFEFRGEHQGEKIWRRPGATPHAEAGTPAAPFAAAPPPGWEGW
jgi:hypothetical protein